MNWGISTEEKATAGYAQQSFAIRKTVNKSGSPTDMSLNDLTGSESEYFTPAGVGSTGSVPTRNTGALRTMGPLGNILNKGKSKRELLRAYRH